MRAFVGAAVAVSLVAGCATGGGVDDDAPPASDARAGEVAAVWPAEVAAAWVGVPSDETGVAPVPLDDVALVVVDPDGVLEWHGDARERPVAIASESRVALVRGGDEGAVPDWRVWDLRTDEAPELTCAEGEPVVDRLLEPRADAFLVLGGCGDGLTVATIDASTGVLAPGEPAPEGATAMWLPGSGGFVAVDGAPGLCHASGPAQGSRVDVTCEEGDELFVIGAVDLAPDDTTGTYVPDPDLGEYPQFYRSTAFTHLDRHWVNSNTIEGTPLLTTAVIESEHWMTALAPLGDRVFMARGLDPYGPQASYGPSLGWYDPEAEEYQEMKLPDGAAGVAHWAIGVPVG